jgi:hypothetical protein
MITIDEASEVPKEAWELLNRKSLDEIGKKHSCDKSSIHHGYCDIYERYFQRWRDDVFIMLELGFGGYEYPDRGGAGAKMWAEYFYRAHIYTTDIHDKNPLNHDRIHFERADQTDPAYFADLFKRVFTPRIIIDDASHISVLTIKSFEALFPHLKRGGIYVVEDTHASYWSEHEFDGTTNIQDLSVRSTMNYFKLLADGLNYEHLRDSAKLIPAFHDQIESIHFYKQMIFVLKKL